MPNWDDNQPVQFRPRSTILGIVFIVACLAAAGLLLAGPAHARAPVPAPVFKAVRHYWKTKAERIKAFDVIACETGNRYNTTARNGQYLGLFQMGSYARARFGHGDTARAQARSAFRYWQVAGWAPWECA